MVCVNGHPLAPGQQFCGECGQQAAAPPPPPTPDSGAAPAPPMPPPADPTTPSGFGPSSGAGAPTTAFQAPPVGGVGTGASSAAYDAPPAASPPPASGGAQVEAQAAKWAPARRQFLAFALVVAAALLEVSAFISAVAVDYHGVSGAWKLRLLALAGPSIVVGVMLVLAAYLGTTASTDVAQAVDLGKKAMAGVLIVAAVTLLTVLLGLLADLGGLGDDFGQAVAQLVNHLAALVLLAAAAAGATMARSAKV